MHHVIETDFEPDDAIGMLMHAKQSHGINLTVIVGESHAAKKMHLVSDFYERVQTNFGGAYLHVEIFEGISSAKKYPLGIDSDYQTEEQCSILDKYKAVYARNPDVVYMMKPPREAMMTEVLCPNTEVFCYGSFNWRTLKLPVEDFQKLTSRYKRFNYFDSFTVIGEHNSAHFLPPPQSVDFGITKLIIAWNQHIVKECEMNLTKSVDKDEIARTLKIITNVKDNLTTQFVVADVCLFAGLLPNKPVRLVSVKPYPKWESWESSKIGASSHR